MRRTARENAFKLIFESLINPEADPAGFDELTADIDDDDKTFLDALVGGVESERDFLSKTIAGYASGFSLSRIYKIDLAILLTATYEILFMPDVPDKASANEAVELAKVYSTDKSPAFVNGVLASVIRDKEEILNDRDAD